MVIETVSVVPLLVTVKLNGVLFLAVVIFIVADLPLGVTKVTLSGFKSK